MAQQDDDKPRKLPEKFRASTDPKDAAAFARLAANDEYQREIGGRVNSPFTASSPRDIARSKAYITIETLSKENKLTPDQFEILAEAYAQTGQYDQASGLSRQHKDLYRKYWKAVWLPDDKWCEHPEKRKYIKEYVFSLKEGKEMPLLACGVCGTWNVLDAPNALVSQTKRESEIMQAAPKGVSIADALEWHKRNVQG